MSIQKANQYFKNGVFAEALLEYQKTVEKTPSLKKVLAYNIEYCEKKLAIGEKVLEAKENISFKKLLSVDFTNNINKELPDFKHIQNLLNSITSLKQLDEKTIYSLLICVKSSPFQKKLLNYVYLKLLNNKYKHLIDNIDIGLNLATMLKLASEKDFWLLNRHKVKEKNVFLYTKNSRFRKMLDVFNLEESYTTFSFELTSNIKWTQSNTIAKDKTITFGTILLNEQKFIGLSLYQHYTFCDNWILVEGTCLGYPTRKVTENGFSKDFSSNIIEIFPDPNDKLKYVKHGWTSANGEDAKSELRNEYLKYTQEDFLVVLDADEFYIKDDLIEVFKKFDNPKLYGITLPQVHFWKNTQSYITGEYYDISHTRIYRNINGMKYIQNHNFPEINGEFVHKKGHFKYKRTQIEKKDRFTFEEPCCYHMGFAKDYDDMKDKSDYYVNRGEDTTRQSTTESRAAWFNGELPEKCRVKKWCGPLPEVLKSEEI